ncbi:MAG: hypothetical protein ACRYG8_10345 [Janthinobacterium lividum]
MLVAPAAGLLGAIIGVRGAASTGVKLENHKRRRDGQAVAVSMAAAIETSIWVVERRQQVQFFEWLLEQAKAGETIQIFGAVDENRLTDPIADALLDRLGLIDADLGARSTRFFTILYGIRVDILNLREGRLGNDPATAVRMLEQDLALWEEASVEGTRLVAELRTWAKDQEKRRFWQRRQASG